MNDEYFICHDQWGVDEIKDDCFILFPFEQDQPEDIVIGWYYGTVGKVGFAKNE